MIKESLGVRIARLRSERRMTQEDLEQKTGISRRTLQNIEYGKTEDPGVMSLLAIAQVLEVPIDELIAGKRNQGKRKASDLTVDELVHTISAISGKPQELGDDESELLGLYRSLGERERLAILDFARTGSAVQKRKSTPGRRRA